MTVGCVVRVTAGKLLAAVTVTVCLLLAADAWRMAQPTPQTVLATAFDCAQWLKENGIEVESEPVWEKEIFFSDSPQGETETYLCMLESQDFTPREHLGKPLCCRCFRVREADAWYARVITDDGVLVGADRFEASPNAVGYLPMRQTAI